VCVLNRPLVLQSIPDIFQSSRQLYGDWQLEWLDFLENSVLKGIADIAQICDVVLL
jgi:hypothetical protein